MRATSHDAFQRYVRAAPLRNSRHVLVVAGRIPHGQRLCPLPQSHMTSSTTTLDAAREAV
jgi:hypothetical protein